MREMPLHQYDWGRAREEHDRSILSPHCTSCLWVAQQGWHAVTKLTQNAWCLTEHIRQHLYDIFLVSCVLMSTKALTVASQQEMGEMPLHQYDGGRAREEHDGSELSPHSTSCLWVPQWGWYLTNHWTDTGFCPWWSRVISGCKNFWDIYPAFYVLRFTKT